MSWRVDGSSADGYEGDVQVIDVQDFNSILDDIESYVNTALKELEGIKGIDRIDDCRKTLYVMLDSLY